MAIVHDIIMTFKHQADGVLDKIKLHVEQGDVLAVLDDVHLLKGSGLALGTIQLVELCRSILDKGRKGTTVKELIPELDELPGIYLKTCKALSLWEESE